MQFTPFGGLKGGDARERGFLTRINLRGWKWGLGLMRGLEAYTTVGGCVSIPWGVSGGVEFLFRREFTSCVHGCSGTGEKRGEETIVSGHAAI